MIIRNRPKRPLNLRKKQDGFLMWPERFRQPSSGTTYKDPYWDKTVLNLAMNGTDGSATFTDTSLYGKTVTANGNARISTAQSKFGGASALFNAPGAWISAAANSDFALFSGNFTVEFWIRFASATANQTLVQLGVNDGNRANISLLSGNLILYTASGGSGSIKISATAPAVDTWHHVAWVRSGTTTTLYVNGASVGALSGISYHSTTNNLFSAGDNSIGPGTSLNGNIDSLRITKGVARYVADFIPPVREHPTEWGDQYWNETVLNCNFNTTITDSSISANVLTANGNAAISTAQKKYGAGSAYFDGSGDYLSIPATSTEFQLFGSDFTVECWVYPQNTSSNQAILEFYVNEGNRWNISFVSNINWYTRVGGAGSQKIAATAPSISTWHHIALVKSGPTFTLYVNGVSVGSSTTTNYPTGPMSLYVGSGGGASNYQGYIDDLRITKGVARYTTDFIPPPLAFPEAIADPYAPYTVLHLPMDGVNGATVFTDQSWSPRTVTANGNVQISTAQSKFGGASAYFDGSGDYLSIPNSSAFDFGSGDFTISLFVKFATFGSYTGVLGKRAGEPNYSPFMIESNGSSQLRFLVSTSGSSWIIITSSTLTTGVWYHVAAVRSGSNLIFFIDGVSQGTASISGALITNTNAITIGRDSEAVISQSQLNGYIDDLRITKGIARNTTNFTPPRIAHPIS